MADMVFSGVTFTGGYSIALPSVATDPYFMYNSLLLPGTGTNLAQNNTFLDGSTNNFAITRAGNTTQGTFSPYGSNWSNYFDGSGDYLTAANNAAFNFGTGSFTVECWVNLTAYTANGPIIDFGNGNSTTRLALIQANSSGSFMWYQGSSGSIITSSIAVSLNTWNHVAIVRNGTGCTMYINGISAGTATNSQSYSDANCFIGKLNDSSDYYISGYLSNLRVVKGTAVYTSNFTPSTTPLTAITNTSLLTCQSNRFIDNSTNVFAITVNGNTNIQRFSPFSPGAAYSASTIGGSAYFDGTGDYLNVASATASGSGSFCLEAWIYSTNSSAQQMIIANETSGGMFLGMNVNSANKLGIGRTFIAIDNEVSVTWIKNTWYHIVVNRNGSSLQFFVNGVQVGSTFSNSINYSTSGRQLGSESNGTSPFYGYISDLRCVNSSVYTAAFTPPTAPLTAISGTSLLTNMTNGAIFDNAMINNLETVGDAKISTTQSKFGGSSMAFDGTGDYLTTPFSPLTQFGTGDFTIEFWLYRAAGSVYQTILDTRISGTASPWAVLLNSSNQPYILIASDITSSIAVASATWTHIAICRASGTLRIFNDGVVGYSGANSTSMMPTGPLRIGKTIDNVYDLNGYIDDLRITKGYARYTATFTPPTAAFPLY